MKVCKISAPTGTKIPVREGAAPSSRLPMACSPPYKRVRALRLFDSPATPKTLIEKSSMHTPIPNKCTRLFAVEKPRPVASCFPSKLGDTKPAANVNPFTPNGMLLTARKRRRSKRSLNGYNKINNKSINKQIIYFASSLRKLCFRENFFFRDISVRVLRIV